MNRISKTDLVTWPELSSWHKYCILRQGLHLKPGSQNEEDTEKNYSQPPSAIKCREEIKLLLEATEMWELQATAASSSENRFVPTQS